MTSKRRILFLGGTGTIGKASVRTLLARGHEVVCFTRRVPPSEQPPSGVPQSLPTPTFRYGDVTETASLARDGIRGERFDSIVSCLASRTGAPRDAWAIDYQAHVDALAAAQAAGIRHMLLLSAICVQKPLLAFQRAKLAFEERLRDSGMAYTVIRPTAFFKSLCGQVERVKQGKPFLVFGDGTLTACKPISDRDLAGYIADCLVDAGALNRVLPIGGPGDPITPRAQAERLFQLLRRPVRIRQVPVGLLSGIVHGLRILGHVSPALADKAELARIGRYYATESMLVLNPSSGRYDAEATPSTGTDTLFDLYARLINGESAPDRGDHAVF